MINIHYLINNRKNILLEVILKFKVRGITITELILPSLICNILNTYYILVIIL